MKKIMLLIPVIIILVCMQTISHLKHESYLQIKEMLSKPTPQDSTATDYLAQILKERTLLHKNVLDDQIDAKMIELFKIASSKCKKGWSERRKIDQFWDCYSFSATVPDWTCDVMTGSKAWVLNRGKWNQTLEKEYRGWLCFADSTWTTKIFKKRYDFVKNNILKK